MRFDRFQQETLFVKTQIKSSVLFVCEIKKITLKGFFMGYYLILIFLGFTKGLLMVYASANLSLSLYNSYLLPGLCVGLGSRHFRYFWLIPQIQYSYKICTVLFSFICQKSYH